MPKYKQAPRLRRTLDPAPTSLQGIKRSIVGLTERYAADLLAQQSRELGARHSLAGQSLRHQVQENVRLEGEINQLRQRLTDLRSVTDSLTQRLSRMRETTEAATGDLQSKLNQLQWDHAAAIGDLKFETVRAGAELQLERQSFRDFLADLYQTLTSRDLLPARDEILLPHPPEAPKAGPMAFGWQPLLSGKVAARTVEAPGGEVIVRAGDRISADSIATAERKGLLPDLFLAVRHPR